MITVSHVIGFVVLVVAIAGYFALTHGGASREEERRRAASRSKAAYAGQPWDAEGRSGRANR